MSDNYNFEQHVEEGCQFGIEDNDDDTGNIVSRMDGEEKGANNEPKSKIQTMPRPPKSTPPSSLPQNKKRKRTVNQTAAVIKPSFDDSNDFERRRLLIALEDAVPVVHHTSSSSSPPPPPLQDKTSYFLPLIDSKNSIGIGMFKLTNEEYNAMNQLSDLIIRGVRSDGVTWGDDAMNDDNQEGEEEGNDEEMDCGFVDPRRRMYGFLNRQALIDSGIKISTFDDDGRNEKEHRKVLHSASVDLKLIPPKPSSSLSQEDGSDHRAVDKDDGRCTTANSGTITIDVYNMPTIASSLLSITEQVFKLVPLKYKKYVSMEQLIAVQPNLHNGASYLPLHLDLPRLDGFGVVIVTLAIRGNGTIVLVDDGDDDNASCNDAEGNTHSNTTTKNGNDCVKDHGQQVVASSTSPSKSFSFCVEEGYSYILCDDARNKCMHGVLANTPSDCARVTLNLRYGLHTEEFAYEEIDRHWK